jgi:hypothetical protein
MAIRDRISDAKATAQLRPSDRISLSPCRRSTFGAVAGTGGTWRARRGGAVSALRADG